jgi:hypothetical protein
MRKNGKEIQTNVDFNWHRINRSSFYYRVAGEEEL